MIPIATDAPINTQKLFDFLNSKEDELRLLLRSTRGINDDKVIISAVTIFLTYVFAYDFYKNDPEKLKLIRCAFECTTHLLLMANPHFSHFVLLSDAMFENLCEKDRLFIEEQIKPNICIPFENEKTNFVELDVPDRRSITRINALHEFIPPNPYFEPCFQ
jgi:hypothetical protein